MEDAGGGLRVGQMVGQAYGWTDGWAGGWLGDRVAARWKIGPKSDFSHVDTTLDRKLGPNLFSRRFGPTGIRQN